MEASSIWPATAGESAPLPALQSDLEVDVVILGAGITGLTTALQLTDAGGLTVAVLEADTVGGGTTGSSTGNLYATVDQGLAKIRQKWGDEILREVVAARLAAMAAIRSTVSRYGIACGLIRSPLYMCVSDEDAAKASMLDDEREAAAAAGLSMEAATAVPLPFGIKRALRLDDQAQCNPSSYVRGLAAAIASESCRIYEHSQVVDFDVGAGVVRTAAATVRAKHIVFATHTPKGISLLHTELGPYREYGIAARTDSQVVPPGAYWIMDKTRSIRSYQSGGEQWLVVIGEEHKTGHLKEEAGYYSRVIDFAQQHFGMGEPDYCWSAQNYRAADELPYIGRSPGHDNLYVGTGYATSGLVYGTVAGMLISDLILDRENRYQSIFDPRRFTPAKSAARLLKENISVAGDLLKDYTAPAELEQAEDVPRGEGRIVKVGGDKLAVYRDAEGKLTTLSPVCPHMKCLVRWNDLDKSWDCPCHGSRFHADGRFIEGPALRGLEPHSPAS